MGSAIRRGKIQGADREQVPAIGGTGGIRTAYRPALGLALGITTVSQLSGWTAERRLLGRVGASWRGVLVGAIDGAATVRTLWRREFEPVAST